MSGIGVTISSEITKTVRTVRHIAKPSYKARENPPHLSDLRAFVAACDGLPDDVLVRIDKGQLNESGRHDVTFSATLEVVCESGGTP